MTHTLGPWKVHEDQPKDNYCPLIQADDPEGYSIDIANVSRPDSNQPDNTIANAKLIAAAPEMLAALIFCLSFLTANDDGEDDVVERIKAAKSAILKATGEQACGT